VRIGPASRRPTRNIVDAARRSAATHDTRRQSRRSLDRPATLSDERFRVRPPCLPCLHLLLCDPTALQSAAANSTEPPPSASTLGLATEVLVVAEVIDAEADVGGRSAGCVTA
jgi:hypothetical protein